MKRKKILELHKQHGNNNKYKIVYNNIELYSDKCGVWMMYDNHNQLLEVAQAADIFQELKHDLSLILKTYSNQMNFPKKYTARRLFDFNQTFSVLSCDQDRRAAKYRTIVEKSETIVVYIVLDDLATSRNKEEREEIEMKIAINNRALYWNAYGKQRRLAKEYYKKIRNRVCR